MWQRYLCREQDSMLYHRLLSVAIDMLFALWRRLSKLALQGWRRGRLFDWRR